MGRAPTSGVGVPAVVILAVGAAVHAALLCGRAHDAAAGRTTALAAACGRAGSHPVAHVVHEDASGRFRLLRLEEGGGAAAAPQRALGGSAVLFVPDHSGDWTEARALVSAYSRLAASSPPAADVAAAGAGRLDAGGTPPLSFYALEFGGGGGGLGLGLGLGVLGLGADARLHGSLAEAQSLCVSEALSMLTMRHDAQLAELAAAAAREAAEAREAELSAKMAAAADAARREAAGHEGGA